ncbi:ADP-ribosylglycohydrolase family protein [Streptomyces canus]|uniref:ADP-ribosylglycohydrolase family protein n=1 Tax=Streptomyces canus TaxID=58343 RepID=UPI0036E00FC9
MIGPWTMESAVVYRARARGCLLGGAIGDALGYPIEFTSLDGIRAAHGPDGVTGFPSGAVARISDDTQMTLFTAEALTQAVAREQERGLTGAWSQLLAWGYERWLETQNKPGPEQATVPEGSPRGSLVDQTWLYSRRAPGNACLSGTAQKYHPDPWHAIDGKAGRVNPNSKGCGTVMRSAPFGLCDTGQEAFEKAARGAQITHGHPTGYYAAGALAAIVAHLVTGDSLEGAVLRAMRLLARYPGHEETSTALGRAVDLAAQGGEPTADRVESLGAGWVAEEALAIGVYSALAHPGPREVRRALLLSVNHSGDSDSTGSICGNLVGARHGDVGLPQEWVERVEGRAVIAAVADDLAGTCVRL